MRLWLRDDERRPDPVPVKTDDRKAVLVGLLLWAVALVVTLVVGEPLLRAGGGTWLWTLLVGLVLGLLGLAYLAVKRLRG